MWGSDSKQLETEGRGMGCSDVTAYAGFETGVAAILLLLLGRAMPAPPGRPGRPWLPLRLCPFLARSSDIMHRRSSRCHLARQSGAHGCTEERVSLAGHTAKPYISAIEDAGGRSVGRAQQSPGNYVPSLRHKSDRTH